MQPDSFILFPILIDQDDDFINGVEQFAVEKFIPRLRVTDFSVINFPRTARFYVYALRLIIPKRTATSRQSRDVRAGLKGQGTPSTPNPSCFTPDEWLLSGIVDAGLDGELGSEADPRHGFHPSDFDL
ncbi:hypothetical protein FV222_15755 [Methylobacterium sp. WL103]|uniref:hypothetical protein n=1 Tax=Methylobacterium sp. WL103 TaxID=2603891 RepID=UPI0011CC305C|nr:hypothetical protein [Methylobacterium sp. WL103]TXM97604.1 hypothetical protein FV222_15755 [Methylobacterium sp. WL103]